MSCTVCGCPVFSRGLCSAHYKSKQRSGELKILNRPRAALEDRFWAKVAKTETCWIWTGGKSFKGYGAIQEAGRGSRGLLAHRVSFELANGPIPDGLYILHSCDNPRCVNPAHLRAGTQSENIAEAYEKKRKISPFSKAENRYQGPRPSMPGTKNPNSRLSEADVHAIRASTEKPGILAKRFNIIPDYVTLIRKRKVWKHV